MNEIKYAHEVSKMKANIYCSICGKLIYAPASYWVLKNSSEPITVSSNNGYCTKDCVKEQVRNRNYNLKLWFYMPVECIKPSVTKKYTSFAVIQIKVGISTTCPVCRKSMHRHDIAYSLLGTNGLKYCSIYCVKKRAKRKNYLLKQWHWLNGSSTQQSFKPKLSIERKNMHIFETVIVTRDPETKIITNVRARKITVGETVNKVILAESMQTTLKKNEEVMAEQLNYQELR